MQFWVFVFVCVVPENEHHYVINLKTNLVSVLNACLMEADVLICLCGKGDGFVSSSA